jgi:hypothetical protein
MYESWSRGYMITWSHGCMAPCDVTCDIAAAMVVGMQVAVGVGGSWRDESLSSCALRDQIANSL